jgi:Predicted membrane protein (DUF2306)
MAWAHFSGNRNFCRVVGNVSGTASANWWNRHGHWPFLERAIRLAAAAMAYYAIRLRNIPQHKEWMIRTYVLACNGIVGDRILANIPILVRKIGIDAVNDLSGWLLWAAPLMIAEVIIQLRRLRKTRRRSTLSMPV